MTRTWFSATVSSRTGHGARRRFSETEPREKPPWLRTLRTWGSPSISLYSLFFVLRRIRGFIFSIAMRTEQPLVEPHSKNIGISLGDLFTPPQALRGDIVHCPVTVEILVHQLGRISNVEAVV